MIKKPRKRKILFVLPPGPVSRFTTRRVKISLMRIQATKHGDISVNVYESRNGESMSLIGERNGEQENRRFSRKFLILLKLSFLSWGYEIEVCVCSEAKQRERRRIGKERMGLLLQLQDVEILYRCSVGSSFRM